ncbi:unnamed protein product [Sphagnum troendelagicum]|uniref:Uncharacterized protein n=1 Tax=Sphagnum jensenii TaxID=128206 RepID=A0ABP1BZT6_9BRYO
MSFKLMQLPCEEDSDFFGDENLQVYAGYCSDPKADRGGFMHGSGQDFDQTQILRILACLSKMLLLHNGSQP